MSEQPSDYCPAPDNIWRVNASNGAPPFLMKREPFDIITNVRAEFFLVLNNKQTVRLHYDHNNLFMFSDEFSLDGETDTVRYLINFKLAPPIHIGRSRKTLYCTTTTLIGPPEKDIQDSEQGVFGAEEDGGSLEVEPPVIP